MSSLVGNEKDGDGPAAYLKRLNGVKRCSLQ